MKKLVKLIYLIIFCIALTAAINIYMKGYSLKHLLTVEQAEEVYNQKSADCAIVLGASVNADGTPSKILKLRLDRGIELYKKGLAKKLLLTGDNAKIEYNEVEAMKNYVLSMGVSGEDIFLDHAGFTTYESMYRAIHVFNVKNAIVVTQRFHETRAIYMARKLGLDAKGVSSDDVERRDNKKDFIREYFARVKGFVNTAFKPKSTYLGDVIDISGSGYASW